MTVDSYLSILCYLQDGVRLDGLPLAKCVAKGAVVLYDVSYIARRSCPPNVGHKSWYAIFQIIERMLQVLVEYNTPSDSAVKWPIVVGMDDRAIYPEERQFVQDIRYKSVERYDSLPRADCLDAKLDFHRLLNTAGGHKLLISAYAAWTSLPLIIIQGRSDPVLFCNTQIKPKFFKHPALGVEWPMQLRPWCEAGVHFPALKKASAQHTVHEVDVHFPKHNGASHTWVSECDVLLPWLASLELELNPHQPVYILGCDGDYIMRLLMVNLAVPVLWPTAGDVVVYSRFNIGRLLQHVPLPMRMSVATCVYLAGSDFNPALPLVSPAAMLSITLGLAAGCYPVAQKFMDAPIEARRKLCAACTEIYAAMTFVDPETRALDMPKLIALLRLIVQLESVSYTTKAKKTAPPAKRPRETDATEETTSNQQIVLLAYDARPEYQRVRRRICTRNPILSDFVSQSKVNPDVLADGFTFTHSDRVWTVRQCAEMAHRFACYLSFTAS